MLLNLWQVLRDFRPAFYKYLVLIVLLEAINIAYGYIISGTIVLFERQSTDIEWVIAVIGFLAFNEIWNRLDNAADWHIISRLGFPIHKHLKVKALEKFFQLNLPWHQNNNSGVLVGKVNSGVDKINDIVNALSWEFIPTLIQTILSLIPLAIFSPWTCIITLVSLAIFMRISIKYHYLRLPLRKSRYDAYEKDWKDFNDNVRAIRTLKVFGLLDRFLGFFVNTHNTIQDRGLTEYHMAVYQANRKRIRIIYLTRTIVLIIWVWQLRTGAISVPTLIFINILFEKLLNAAWRFARLFERADENSEGAERYFNLLKEESSFVEATLPPAPKRNNFDIRFSQVCFSYNGGYSTDDGAIHKLDLTIETGEIIALVGPSGSGKSTITNLVTGLFRPQQGELTIGGVPVEEWPSEILLQNIAEVPQGDNVFIFDKSIEWNIRVGNFDASLEEVTNAAKLAGIHDYISSLKKGYDTKVGEKGIRLSGGQKQRIALARAILANRQILILDEATSAVDAITEEKIQSLMKTISAGRTVIIIAHRLSTIWSIADKIVVMDGGKKVEEGSHAELVAQQGLYSRMVALQTH